MQTYSHWINWFRKVAPNVPGGMPEKAMNVSPSGTERFRRVIGGMDRPAAMDLGDLASLTAGERMIRWLETQPPVIVDAAAAELNWSQAEAVVLWLIRRTSTDAATAVKLFLRAEPAYFAQRKAENPAYRPSEFDEAVITTFAANWIAERYPRGGVGYDPREVSPYGSSDIARIDELNEIIARNRSNGAYSLPALPGLAGPFNGPKPPPLEAHLQGLRRNELFLVRFLFAGLGTWILDEAIDEAGFDAWLEHNGLGVEEI